MKAKVLVVDDETEFVELMQYNLAREGFEVFTATNGIEALHEARRILPDAILLDVMLPDMDGLSVCEILRMQPSTTDVPVIIVSALDGEVIRGRSLQARATCRFKKPVDIANLCSEVRKLCEEQQETVRRRVGAAPADPLSERETTAT